jgi:3-oxoacyl-[acyl-carrier protein] reductase
MPLALVTGSARANSIAAGIVPRLVADGWRVVTSDLESADYLFDLSTPTGPEALIAAVTRDEGPISGLVLSHAHDIESGVLDTTAESFDRHVAVNARASLLLIAAFARQIPEDGGAIVARPHQRCHHGQSPLWRFEGRVRPNRHLCRTRAWTEADIR